jgi:hypothetical protein
MIKILVEKLIKLFYFNLEIYQILLEYVQGMNYLAASLIYHAEEYISFFILDSMMNYLNLKDIYIVGYFKTTINNLKSFK